MLVIMVFYNKLLIVYVFVLFYTHYRISICLLNIVTYLKKYFILPSASLLWKKEFLVDL